MTADTQTVKTGHATMGIEIGLCELYMGMELNKTNIAILLSNSKMEQGSSESSLVPERLV